MCLFDKCSSAFFLLDLLCRQFLGDSSARPSISNISLALQERVYYFGTFVACFWNEIKWPYLRLRTTHILYVWCGKRHKQYLSPFQKQQCRRKYTTVFGSVINIASVFYRTKHQVCGLCVGGGIIILIFGSFQKHGENCNNHHFFHIVGVKY